MNPLNSVVTGHELSDILLEMFHYRGVVDLRGSKLKLLPFPIRRNIDIKPFSLYPTPEVRWQKIDFNATRAIDARNTGNVTHKENW
jgi:hypothetical protein